MSPAQKTGASQSWILMRVLTESDFTALRALLADAGLPTDDLRARHLRHFVGVHDGDVLLAAGGLERFDDVALLRSVVTRPDRRRKGLAGQVVEALEQAAAASGVTRLFLLTETAEDFFAARGYRVLPREDAPPAIAGTAQFSRLCPGDATFMHKVL